MRTPTSTTMMTVEIQVLPPGQFDEPTAQVTVH